MKTSSELESFLIDDLSFPIMPLWADETYSLPDKTWLFGDFAAALKNFQFKFGVMGYRPSNNDCDNFAKIAVCFADILHSYSKIDTGIAIGEFWYVQDSGGAHAILVAIVMEDGKLKLKFMEPQTGEELKLSDKEIESCTLIKF